MPLIVVLMLICVIATIYIVGAGFGRKAEIAELNKDIEKQEEKISAATDIAATSIGTNTKATFTASTGEINIYNSSTSGGTATMSKSSWNTFLKKITDTDGNLNAVKTITFDNEVKAPADSSCLFYPIISNANYPFLQLVAINNLDNLDVSTVTHTNSMFRQCEKLTEIDMSAWNFSKTVKNAVNMFSDCSSLVKVIWPSSSNFVTEDSSAMFYNCVSLVDLDIKNFTSFNFSSAFYNCSSLKSLRWVAYLSSGDDMDGDVRFDSFKNVPALEYLSLENFPHRGNWLTYCGSDDWVLPSLKTYRIDGVGWGRS